jgi:hypothetical protein
MPIRFRCKYCNQLMGIARRKVGTEVECPTCKGKLLVPQTSAEPDPSPEPAVPPPPLPNSPPLFERSDFGDLFNPPQAKEPILAGAQQTAAPPAAPPRPQSAPQPRALRLPSSYDVDVEPMPGAMAPSMDPNAVGIVLTPGRATLLTVAVILGLALAFSLGLLVGKWL